ncbi:hypothetical protein SK128_006072 [Halocaridina rubra]|uniref:Carbohydrate sulfotransferase n=1 Tax=Halocaridina rubra TaxID=373956 RepID=A0AAN8X7D8_HALRR
MIEFRYFRIPICRIPFVVILLICLWVFLLREKEPNFLNVLDKDTVMRLYGEKWITAYNETKSVEAIASDITRTNSPGSEGKSLKATESRLTERRERILEICRNKTKWFSCPFHGVLKFNDYFFHDYNVTICSIAKAGSSTWRYHLRRVNNGPPFNIPIYKDAIRNAFLDRPLENVIRDINISSKIITVRHPLTRLVSAYRNKYKDGKMMPANRPRQENIKRKRQSGSYWDDRFYQFWLPALFANNKVPADIHTRIGLKEPLNPKTKYKVWVYEALYPILKPRITFIQFLRYVVKTFEDNNPDAHWRSYYMACCPCHFDYEYITQVETLSEDLEFVFNQLGLPSDPDVSMNQYRKTVEDIYRDYQYYKRVPQSLKREIYRLYKTDMDFFGYNLPKNF